ncbi:MAG: sigma-70 family RNA polymerase sigma factor [Sarcina sp.]
MAQGLNDLIKKYYEGKKVDLIFNEILECCSYEIRKSIEKYAVRERDEMEQEARIKIYNLLMNHKLDKMLNSPDKDISSYLKTAIDNSLKDKKKKERNDLKDEYAIPFFELENKCITLKEIFEFENSFEDVFNEFIKVLTRKQKEVMKLIYLEGLKEKEIAAILNVQRQDINNLKNRAKKAIKANLTQNDIDVNQIFLYEVVI